LHSAGDDGIVVGEVRKEDAVDVHAVPPALRLALGPDATRALIETIERSHHDARPAMIAACTERFERRLVEEVSRLRVEMAQQGADLRQEMGTLGVNLRQEMGTLGADLRQEIGTLGVDLRQEMGQLGVDLRQEMGQLGVGLRQEMGQLGVGLRQEMGQLGVGLRADVSAGRVEMVKWLFLFWVGQVIVMTGIMGALLRTTH
jgi:hypothetical protein